MHAVCALKACRGPHFWRSTTRLKEAGRQSIRTAPMSGQLQHSHTRLALNLCRVRPFISNTSNVVPPIAYVRGNRWAAMSVIHPQTSSFRRLMKKLDYDKCKFLFYRPAVWPISKSIVKQAKDLDHFRVEQEAEIRAKAQPDRSSRLREFECLTTASADLSRPGKREASNPSLLDQSPVKRQRIHQNAGLAVSKRSPVLETGQNPNFDRFDVADEICVESDEDLDDADLLSVFNSFESVKGGRESPRKSSVTRFQPSNYKAIETPTTQNLLVARHEDPTYNATETPAKSRLPLTPVLRQPKVLPATNRSPTKASTCSNDPKSNNQARSNHAKSSQATVKGAPAHDPATTAPDNLPTKVTEPSLCPEQAELVELVVQGNNMFYTGSAGCGKSTVLKAFTKRLTAFGKTVDIIAPTGRAALEIGGSTTWTYAGITPDHHKRPLADLRKGAMGRYVRKRLKRTDVLVIDEISMVENLHFERVNEIMKSARGSELPFGGVQLVVTGDFCQLPPVKPFEHCITCGRELIPNASEESYTCREHGAYYDEDKWAFKSKAWTECNFVHFHLRTIHRQSDETFIRILQKLRIGISLLPKETDLLLNHPCKVGQATRLHSTREEVRRVNQTAFDRLVSPKYTFKTLDHFDWNRYRHRHLEHKGKRFSDGSIMALEDHRYDRVVEFKRGMLVVLLVNLDLNHGLCNGSQGIISGYEEFDRAKLPKQNANRYRAMTRIPKGQDDELDDYANIKETQIRNFIEKAEKKVWPIVKFHNGQVKTIYADCSINQLGDDKPYSLLSRTQIPLAPAWAMSIHKSQSMTLNRVIVDLSRVFEEGQVYVALSRATCLEGLKIEGDPKGLSIGKGGNAEVRKFYQEKFGL